MTVVEDVRWSALIERAAAMGLDDPGDVRWRDVLPDHAGCSAFASWATHHPRWLHNVADVADRICAKPVEATIAILSDIVAELRDEG